jgi:hypothetical protein
MPDCPHLHLDKLSGPLHTSGKDYVCRSCGEQLRAEVIQVIIKMGTKEKNSN